MAWNGSQGFHYNKPSALQNAPAVSGVYVLYHDSENCYVGETHNIKDRLIQHLTKEDNPLLAAANPLYFAFLQIGANLRLQVQNQLILELKSTCNRKLG